MQQTQTFEKHSPLPPRAPHFSRLSIFKFVSSPSKILQSFPLLPQSCMYKRARANTHAQACMCSAAVMYGLEKGE